jgi:hypothetical protein
MNNLRWGLDNKIYGAAAGNGGHPPCRAAGEPPVRCPPRLSASIR